MLATSALSTIASFSGIPRDKIVGGLVMDGQGNLYGTTSAGGVVGGSDGGGGKGDSTVFEIPSGSKKVATLASFDGGAGYGINGLSLDGQGNLFGTTTGEGGANGDGMVFKVAAGSRVVTTVASFDGINGEFPKGVTADGQGNLYGTTAVAEGSATAFEIPRGANTISTLAQFSTPGPAPKGVVADGQGNLFGTDATGGVNGTGTVYEIARGSNTVTTLASFAGNNGSGISNVVMDGQGNLYGTTADGGLDGDGTAFEIARGSNIVTTLASFNLNNTNKADNTNGLVPDPNVGVVMDGQGNLYGTTVAGGLYGDGTVFEIARGSGTVTTLTSFKSFSGASVNDLVLDGQGNLFGTTDGAGNSGGTVFKVTLNHQPAASTTAGASGKNVS